MLEEYIEDQVTNILEVGTVFNIISKIIIFKLFYLGKKVVNSISAFINTKEMTIKVQNKHKIRSTKPK